MNIKSYPSSSLKKNLKSSITSKKVLIVAYYFPPIGGSGVQRTLKFVKYLVKYGWEPIVLTVGDSVYRHRDESLLKEIPKSVRIIRIDDTNYHINQSTIKSLVELFNILIEDKKLICEFFNNVNTIKNENDYIYSFMIPEYQILWVLRVLYFIERFLDFDDIDIMYTTSGPYSDHVLGYFLNKKFKMPWITDFRDEWTNNSFSRIDKNCVRHKMNFAMEAEIVKNADFILTVSHGISQSYRKNFKIDHNKVITITNGYDEDDFKRLNPSIKKNKKFTIVHNGMFYSERTPQTFLQAVHKLVVQKKIDKDKLFCVFSYTESEDNWKEYVKNLDLKKNVHFQGNLTHLESLKSANKADILLLVVGASEKNMNVYTGKIFEYLRLNKTILALSPKNSVVEELLTETGRGYNVPFSDVDQIASCLLMLYKKWVYDKLQNFYLDQKINIYSRENTTKKLIHILDGLQNSMLDSI
jgi:glycosyltransferase involved in cell wall biosynthesis